MDHGYAKSSIVSQLERKYQTQQNEMLSLKKRLEKLEISLVDTISITSTHESIEESSIHTHSDKLWDELITNVNRSSNIVTTTINGFLIHQEDSQEFKKEYQQIINLGQTSGQDEDWQDSKFTAHTNCILHLDINGMWQENGEKYIQIILGKSDTVPHSIIERSTNNNQLSFSITIPLEATDEVWLEAKAKKNSQSLGRKTGNEVIHLKNLVISGFQSFSN